jgi:predicted DNA-binding transcriptional regulator YafY
VLRARGPKPRRAAPEAARESVRIAAAVTAIRSGERAAAARPAATTPLSPSGSLAALRDAIETNSSVLIGYVDNHGTASDRVVDPLSVEGGELTAHDHRADDVRRFAIHRITTVKSL